MEGVLMTSRRFVFLLITAALACAGPLAGTASAAKHKPRPHTYRLPSPSWLTSQLRGEIVAQAPKPRDMPEDLIFKSCPGTGPTVPGVQAGTCLVDPFGCTANFG